MLKRYLCLALLIVAIAATARAQQPSPSASPRVNRWLPIELAILADSGEQIAVIDRRAFRTVEALRDYIGTLPPTTMVTFRTFQAPPGDNKFVAAADELKQFCIDHKIPTMFRKTPPSDY